MAGISHPGMNEGQEQMIVALSPVRIALILTGAACTSFYYGTMILRSGWRGIQRRQYPLSEHQMLSGFAGTAAATIIFLFGLMTIACGVVTTIFALYRLPQIF